MARRGTRKASGAGETGENQIGEWPCIWVLTASSDRLLGFAYHRAYAVVKATSTEGVFLRGGGICQQRRMPPQPE